MTAYILRNLAPFSVIMRETEGPANVVDGPSVYEPATCRWDSWAEFGGFYLCMQRNREDLTSKTCTPSPCTVIVAQPSFALEPLDRSWVTYTV
jgi:hypothetical protein